MNCNKEEFGEEPLEDFYPQGVHGSKTPCNRARTPDEAGDASLQVPTQPREPSGNRGSSIPAPLCILRKGLWQSASSHSCTGLLFHSQSTTHWILACPSWVVIVMVITGLQKKSTCKIFKDCKGCSPLILPSASQIKFTVKRRRHK